MPRSLFFPLETGNRKLETSCMSSAMVHAFATWTDHERFLGIASSGHALVVDAGKDKTGPGPMELVLIGLCSCTASDVVSILRKKREPFTGVEVRGEAERAPEPPTVYTGIK